MLRLALLLLYLLASFSAPSLTKQGGSADPLGLNPPPSPATDGGGSADPLG